MLNKILTSPPRLRTCDKHTNKYQQNMSFDKDAGRTHTAAGLLKSAAASIQHPPKVLSLQAHDQYVQNYASISGAMKGEIY